MKQQSDKINILLVEDDEIDVETVRRALQSNGLSNPLWVAGDGEQALTMLQSGEVSRQRLLMLLDLNLPRMSGLELLRELRADPALRALPVVVLTTSDDEYDLAEAFRLNVAGYVLKPVSFSKFIEVVGQIDRYWSLCEMPESYERS